MAKVKKEIKIYLDPIANTFNIWWDDPKKAYSAEEVDDANRNDVIVKDKQGHPISLEIIGIFPKELNVAAQLKGFNGIDKKEPFLLTSAI